MVTAETHRDRVHLARVEALLRRGGGRVDAPGGWLAGRRANSRIVRSIGTKRRRRAGVFRLDARAHGWFDVVAANGGLTDTTLTVTNGARCFALHLTAKFE